MLVVEGVDCDWGVDESGDFFTYSGFIVKYPFNFVLESAA
jgi:hypothetical protein